MNKSEVLEGVIFCVNCDSIYIIEEGIPRLVIEELKNPGDEIIFLKKHKEKIARRWSDLYNAVESTVQKLVKMQKSQVPRWELEEMEFWDSKVYEQQITNLDTIQGKNGSIKGNRILPYEKYLFSHIKSRLPGKTVLEIGCGSSAAVRELCPPKKYTFSYIATDLSINALKLTRSLLDEERTDAEFIQCTAENIPLKEESCDMVFSLGVLHHIPSKEKAIPYLFTFLKKGGNFILCEPLKRKTPLGRIFRRILPLFIKESKHEERLDETNLIDICKKEGKIISIKRDYSPMRTILVLLFGKLMEKSRVMTEIVLFIDSLTIKSVGRYFETFRGGTIYLITTK